MAAARRNSKDWLDLVRNTWNERAPDWDTMSEAHALSSDRTIDIARLVVELDLHHGSALLDAGCGTGQFAVAFASLGCVVTAQDLSPTMIDRATVHARDRKAEVTFRIGDVSSLPDKADTFDAVHARVVMQFVPDPPATLREFRRVLKPAGRLFISVPGSLSPIYNRSWRRFVDPDSVGNTFMVPWELQALLEKSGWSIIDQWGDFGQSLTGDKNDLEHMARNAPLKLQQAMATTWGFVAE